MGVITGYPSQKKEDRLVVEPATVNRAGPFRYGLDTLAHLYVQDIASDAVEASSTTKVINASSHSAEVGDLIIFTTGNLTHVIAGVDSVTTNTITLAQELSEAPATSDAFTIMRFRPPKVDANGVVQTFATSSISSPSSIGNGEMDVTTAGTAEQLIAASTPCVRIHMTAKRTNTDVIWFGGSSVDSTSENGDYLFPAQARTIEIDNVNKVYIDAEVDGEGVCFTYVAS